MFAVSEPKKSEDQLGKTATPDKQGMLLNPGFCILQATKC